MTMAVVTVRPVVLCLENLEMLLQMWLKRYRFDC